MSFKNTPITAKIKRTTKGGITQPLLNMGAPVKMKMHSPAKVDPEVARQKAISKGLDDQKYEGYRNDSAFNDSNMDGNMLSRGIKGLYRAGKKAVMYASGPGGAAMAQVENIKNRKQDIDDYNNAHYVKFKGDNPDLFKSKGKKEDTPKTETTKTKKVSYDTAYKNRDQKTYGKMDKATYIKEAKRQNASKKAGKGWDVKNKGKDTPPRKKVKAASVIEPKGIKKIEISTKLDPKQLKAEVVKRNTKTENPSKKDVRKATRKAKSAGRASDRAARARLKGQQALENGNKQKALRLRRKEGRLKAKATRKRGQAANAIKIQD